MPRRSTHSSCAEFSSSNLVPVESAAMRSTSSARSRFHCSTSAAAQPRSLFALMVQLRLPK